MTHIKRIDEMAESHKLNENINSSIYDEASKSPHSRFINLIVGDFINIDDVYAGTANDGGKYALTVDGMVALYRLFYNNTEDLVDFIYSLYKNSDLGDSQLNVDYFTKTYLALKILEDVDENKIIDAVENEDYTNYIGSGNDMFMNLTTHKDEAEWANGIRLELEK